MRQVNGRRTLLSLTPTYLTNSPSLNYKLELRTHALVCRQGRDPGPPRRPQQRQQGTRVLSLPTRHVHGLLCESAQDIQAYSSVQDPDRLQQQAHDRPGGSENAQISLISSQDFCAVVAATIEYQEEWPVEGGIRGDELEVRELLAIGERIRMCPAPSLQVPLEKQGLILVTNARRTALDRDSTG
jgi:hypothetical protein